MKVKFRLYKVVNKIYLKSKGFKIFNDIIYIFIIIFWKCSFFILEVKVFFRVLLIGVFMFSFRFVLF